MAPKTGFYFSLKHADIARKNIKSLTWAKGAYSRIKAECDAFISTFDDEKLYACILRMKDQVFAYGINGCPNCKQTFPIAPDKQAKMFASYPHQQFTCLNCQMTFPNDRFPDSGDGHMLDGKPYYLIGMWNFYTAGQLLGGVRDHEGMVTRLVYLYMITGELVYAQKALVILDAFAAIYPGTIGPRDFTPFGSKQEMGRLHLLTSVVYRVKVFLAHDYDWLYDLEELDGVSPALLQLGGTETMRTNIENMLHDYLLTEPGGPEYNLDGGRLTGLHNHEADGVRAMLAVGHVLKSDTYKKWGINGAEAYLYNAIGRDGMYFEGSYGYSISVITMLTDIALFAMNASSKEQLESFHPFNTARFFKFCVENPLQMLCQGHLPAYGDWGRDMGDSTQPDARALETVYRSALQFYLFSTNPSIKQRALDSMLKVYPLIDNRLGSAGLDLFFPHPASDRTAVYTPPSRAVILGQAGINILRGPDSQTILMRTGANMTHSHDDALGFTYYAHGKEISADIGYAIYGTNGHYGWGTRAIAHNTLVVNQDQEVRRGQIYKPFSGGSLLTLYESDSVCAIEGEAVELYGIDAYQRMLGMACLPNTSPYLVDFFYADGAQASDYAFHAFQENSTLSLYHTDVVGNKYWTLAGVDYKGKKPYFDEPGKSFGERLTAGETFTPLLSGERAQGWTPEINNGYGFIFNVQEYRPLLNTFAAEWKSFQQHKLKLFHICDLSDRIFSGIYPSLEGSQRRPMLIIRSSRPQKQFASVIQTFNDKTDEDGVVDVHRLFTRGCQVIAFCILLADGNLDFWAYSPVFQRMTIRTRFGEWHIYGRCGWIRTDKTGELLSSACIQASTMQYSGQTIEGKQTAWHTIEKLDRLGERFTCTVPENFSARPIRYIKIASLPTGKSSIYPVSRIEQTGKTAQIWLQDSFILSKGKVTASTKNTVRSDTPLPLAPSFIGKIIIGASGGRAIVTGYKSLTELTVSYKTRFSIGEPFTITDVDEGFYFTPL
ncbi:heparinase II/III family protein [Aneurinibacillus sp. Ricciae_BoGa-3]|nr:heparinase II/III family protein [Aneurinibacillus sp. Ricciae_BoGa-3]WCK56561.1 heparinase II/III family protein [Aneurinibacillus sp. Ricciae_BoGa-3]